MSFPIPLWIGFFIFIACALVADLGFFNKRDKDLGFKAALNMTMIWVLLASIFLQPDLLLFRQTKSFRVYNRLYC